MTSVIPDPPERILPPERLVALDVFRGLTMAAMVVANNPGSWEHVYGPLRDVRSVKWWTKPFVVLGANAIALFVLSGLLVKLLVLIRVPAGNAGSIPLSEWVYESFYVPLASPSNASLLYALTHLAALCGVLVWMYRRRPFLKA